MGTFAITLSMGFSILFFLLGVSSGPLYVTTLISLLYWHSQKSAAWWIQQMPKPENIDWSGTNFADCSDENESQLLTNLITIRPKPTHYQTQAKKDKIRKIHNKPQRFKSPLWQGLPHQILGIDPDATSNLIRTAHRHWLNEFHPDKFQNQKTNIRNLHNERTLLLNQARQDLLKNRKKAA